MNLYEDYDNGRKLSEILDNLVGDVNTYNLVNIEIDNCYKRVE